MNPTTPYEILQTIAFELDRIKKEDMTTAERKIAGLLVRFAYGTWQQDYDDALIFSANKP